MKRLSIVLIIVVNLIVLSSCSKSVKKNNKEQLDRLFTMLNKFDSVSSVQLQTEYLIEFKDTEEPSANSYLSIAKMKRTPFESYEDNTLVKTYRDHVETESFSQFVMEQENGYDVYSQKKEDAPFIKLSYTTDEFILDPQSYPTFDLISSFIKLVTEDMTIISDEATSLVYNGIASTKIGADLTVELVEKLLFSFPIVDIEQEQLSIENYKDIVVGNIDFYISDGNELQAIDFSFDKGMIILNRMGIEHLSLRLIFSKTNTISEIELPEMLKLR